MTTMIVAVEEDDKDNDDVWRMSNVEVEVSVQIRCHKEEEELYCKIKLVEMIECSLIRCMLEFSINLSLCLFIFKS